jgi:hypothetical protein
MTACGKSDAVKNVEAEISALGAITVDSRADIEQIEADYSALTDKEKEQVENLDELDSAKSELEAAELVAKQIAEQIADVENKISDALADPTDDAVNAARTAYDGLDEELKEKITNYADLESAEASLALLKEVAAALDGCTWYFNGGSDTTLNRISFSGTEATIAQVYFDGNGKHDNGENDYDFRVDSANISVTLADGSSLDIPYNINGENVTIGSGDYYTIEEIDAAIQGCWNMRNSETFFGMKTVTDKSISFDNGKVVSEQASLANGSTSGDYYYYGPYEGTYTLNFGGLDTEMYRGGEWFFNIIDGTVTILNYDHICSPSDGLPGENGYSF